MLTKSILSIMCAVLALGVAFVHADIVTLKDGSTIEGKVIEENRARVVIEITISNISTTRTIPRYQVRSIEYKPVETEEDVSEDQDTTESTLDDDTSEQTRDDSDEAVNEDTLSREERLEAIRNRQLYVTIPVEGTIGVETNADGLRKALQQSLRRKAKHIVFVIDCEGGLVYDAVETLKVLKEYDDDFEYHALVEEGAISAASVYVAGADHIWVRADARVGGAVAYTNNASTGATEVDAKLNSIWAADIAARAQSKGHPPEVFRAMVDPGAEVWVDDEGKVFASRPSSRGAQQIDNARTVLTIRADQMIEIGMAKLFEGELDKLGAELDIENWAALRGLGERVMQSASRERVQLQEMYDESIKAFREGFEDFQKNDPRSFNDYTFLRQPDGSQMHNSQSMQRWRERSDKAIRNCDQMLAALTRIAEVNRRAKRAGALHLEVVPDDIGHDVYTTISDAREWLSQNRNNINRP